MSTPMMKCGHAANATQEDGTPCCVICAGIDPGYNQVMQTPDLTGRIAKCGECNNKMPSSPELAFFEYRPGHEFDMYYCGCGGWD